MGREQAQQDIPKLTQRRVWLFSSRATGEGDPVEFLNGWRLPEAEERDPTANEVQELINGVDKVIKTVM